MRTSLNARRKARIIGQDDASSFDDTPQPELSTPDQDLTTTPTVIRPATSRSSSKKRSSLRVSFGPGGTSMTDDADDENTTAVFTPKKSNLSRAAIANNALRKSQLSSEPGTVRNTDGRPSYTAESLHELKSSTPSALQEPSTQDVASAQALDLASKFGTDLALRAGDGVIPAEAEIAEKKARRRRLAQEQEYISLHASNSDDDANDDEEDDESSLNPSKKGKRPSTRLVPDDEDLAEGFDAFVEDSGRVALSHHSAREQRRREKERIRTLISEAEGHHDHSSSASSSDDANDSEAERHAAYEAAQTRAGMDGLSRPDLEQQHQRPRTPPKITPLPSLTRVLEKLNERLILLETQKQARVKRMQEIGREKEGVREREGEIQRLLREKAVEYEGLRGGEVPILAAAEGGEGDGQKRILDGGGIVGRGLEGWGP